MWMNAYNHHVNMGAIVSTLQDGTCACVPKTGQEVTVKRVNIACECFITDLKKGDNLLNMLQ